ncbi:GWxTD domain-containing protein [candidate division KSB1 bacterium]|nr:GWxTD domain-containing protein [candidate division KSB1 bacterium]NIR72850.1 GWxTD domain-containing protein [candidate division KSB1 bacterium]NIS23749.1 GWxTD domain-containing protein [candidate division KSB1 bacterium]NIT70670.1 GWxTD domain-containing protein [candidate division KSB1 bacterium]NIU24399.1 GWxTD domain-containing protein [candidate division KSB1 bacterium]
MDGAEMAYRQALVFDKESVEAYKGLGKVAYEAEDWDAFYRWFEEALELNPDDSEAWHYLQNKSTVRALVLKADTLRSQGHFLQAEKAYKQALKLYENFIDAYKGLAKTAYETEDWKKFNKWIKNGLKIAPADAELNELLKKNPKLKSTISKADSLRKAGEFDPAKKAYKEALKIFENALAACRGLARIAYSEQSWGEVKDWSKKILEVMPDDLESNYYLGIAYRETGKTKNKLIKSMQFGWSEDYFDSVITKDSTFRDVLYQRGLLERWRENWQESVAWAQRQVRLNPDLPAAQIGLFKLCRLYLFYKDEKEALEFFKSLDDEWSTYFLGELHRRNEKFAAADTYFESLLNQETQMSKLPIYLSMVRMALQAGSKPAANKYFTWALDSMKSHVDAEFVFEDTKYIFTDSEFETFRRLTTSEDKQQFFRKFWAKRNPVLAAELQVRAIAHYERLLVAEKGYWFHGVRSWFNNPEKGGYGVLEFPKTYSLNDEFNDKGLIYIRHGEPDDRALASGNFSATYESWKYNAKGQRPQLIFHFVQGVNAVNNNWRLTLFPLPPQLIERLVFAGTTIDPEVGPVASVVIEPDILDQLLGWHPTLDRFILSTPKGSAERMEFTMVVEHMKEDNEITIDHALTSDYHTWDEDTQFLDMPYSIVNFRGPKNQTRVEVSYAVPLEQLEDKSRGSKIVTLKHGIAIYDTLFNLQERSHNSLPLTAENSVHIFQGYFILRQAFNLESNTYQMSLFARAEEMPKIGGWNVKIPIPRFDSPELSLSDLELAYEITEQTGHPVFAKRNMTVIPNPSKTFNFDQPVYLYYEIYNLMQDEVGDTAFELEHTMTQIEKKEGFLKKLFGSGEDRKKSLSITAQREGHESTSIENTAFDVSNLEPGIYELTVRVRDSNSGTVVEKSSEVTIE